MIKPGRDAAPFSLKAARLRQTADQQPDSVLLYDGNEYSCKFIETTDKINGIKAMTSM